MYDVLEVFKSHEACLIRIDFPRMLRDNSTNSDLWSFDVPWFCRWMIAKISFDDNFLLVQHLLHTCIQYFSVIEPPVALFASYSQFEFLAIYSLTQNIKSAGWSCNASFDLPCEWVLTVQSIVSLWRTTFVTCHFYLGSAAESLTLLTNSWVSLKGSVVVGFGGRWWVY